ncbi:hypothetical protein LCGC14_1154540 [marine sediment metagenome]|uniref:Uncharacterized protein n=1 Tax=marine sediment metagenome TaxID=412755 RepID=A0A0F9PCR1_9ZZZZ
MIESKYIEFDKIGDTGKTEIWNILSKKSQFILGKISWYGHWRQYCFFPSPNCIFNVGCLSDISKMVDLLMSERRKNKKGE